MPRLDLAPADSDGKSPKDGGARGTEGVDPASGDREGPSGWPPAASGWLPLIVRSSSLAGRRDSRIHVKRIVRPVARGRVRS